MIEPLFPSFEAVRERVTAQIAALREWERQSFRGGSEAMLIGSPYALSLIPDRKQSQNHCVCLGTGGTVPALFKSLPCGLMSRLRGLESVSRTDASGCIWIKLSDGDYSLRFVNEVHDQVDVEILVQLALQGDRQAVSNLEAAAQDDRLPSQVCDYLAERSVSLPRRTAAAVAAPPGFEVERPSSLWDCFVPMSLSLSLDSGRTLGLSPDACWGLTGDAKRIAIDCPIDKLGGIFFPFGCALVEYLAEDRHVVAAELMPVERNTALGRFQSSLPVARLLPGGVGRCEPGRLFLWEIRDDQEAWNRLGSRMVHKLFPLPEVNADADLLARLSRLKLTLEDEERLI